VLDSTIRELIDELAAEKAPPIYTLSPEEARKTFLRAQSGQVEKPEAQIKDQHDGRPASSAEQEAYRRQNSYRCCVVFSWWRLGAGRRGHT
jgi:hypothetical protein